MGAHILWPHPVSAIALSSKGAGEAYVKAAIRVGSVAAVFAVATDVWRVGISMEYSKRDYGVVGGWERHVQFPAQHFFPAPAS